MTARRAAILGQLVTLAVSLSYCLYVGPVVFFWDSHTLADRAKHVAYFGTLDLNNHPTSIAPPLYSVCIAPAYGFDNPATIQRAILVINALLHALSFLPLLGLFRRYAHLPPAWAAAWATAVALAPHALTYAPFVLTEAAFFPLVYATFYLFSRFDARPRWPLALATGATLALAILCRDAGKSLLLAAAPVGLLHVAAQLPRWRTAAVLGGRYVVLGGFAASASLGWDRYQAAFVKFNAGSGDLWAPLKAMLNSPADLQVHLTWLANCAAYLVLAPLSLVALLVLAIVLTRPRILWRDRLVTWLLLSMFLCAAVAIVVMHSGWGGPTLTWNRYVVPLVGLWFPIALRYRRLVRWPQYGIAVGLLGGLAALGNPARLACHFPDSLAFFMESAQPALPPWQINLAFALLIALSGAPFLLRNRRVGGLLALACVALPFAAVGREGARGWHRNAHNIAGYRGAAQAIVAQMQRAPTTRIYFETSAGGPDPNLFPLARILYWVPPTVPALDRIAAYRALKNESAPLIYVTSAPLLDAQVLGVDNGVIFANLLDPRTVPPLPMATDAQLREFVAARPPPAGFLEESARSMDARIRAVLPGAKVDFEPYGRGHAIWLAPREPGGLTLYVDSPRELPCYITVDIGIIGPSTRTPGACRLRVANLSIPEGRRPAILDVDKEIDAVGPTKFGTTLVAGLNRIVLEVPSDAGPGRAGADPRELMLLIRNVRLEAFDETGS